MHKTPWHELCKNVWTDQYAIWVMDSGGPKEACIRWGRDPHAKRQLLGEGHVQACPTTFCRELHKNGWTDRFSVWFVDCRWLKEARVQSYSPMCPSGRAHWRHLANTIEPLSTAAIRCLQRRLALRQITLPLVVVCSRLILHWQNKHHSHTVEELVLTMIV